jgi:hypothetical protein
LEPALAVPGCDYFRQDVHLAKVQQSRHPVARVSLTLAHSRHSQTVALVESRVEIRDRNRSPGVGRRTGELGQALLLVPL